MITRFHHADRGGQAASLVGDGLQHVHPRRPQGRAAALLQLLIHVPALERSNALFASAVACAYLVASGLKVVTSPEQVRDLARLVETGDADVDAIAAELRRWCA
ncbi:hypothetical protein ROS62_22050 [Streptomyces sp. DSM 41972]|uniref:Fic family toxin-antitoxin system, toxin component n=1 Tax=Streptomyces althioticus subsp. attaecolombicae TaxID=3075534 RepID=A0ABU3I392_9ACTN|nr:hypothetical protein [Streptomyces sp. DSM 41972]SCD76862.1 hypothetical protein GA0115238_123912 [Streptomyces sp. di50b]SCD87867.1 hypothetical protein GA0115245_115613 [Streptomyces sp. di188]